MSWDETFASRYDEWSAHMTADVAFYVELASKADGPVVELAIGSGRVGIPVAKAIGRMVIGIDSSPAMLEQARVRANDAGVELDLREGDRRELALEQPAGLIYCPYRSLLHLPTWADRVRAFTLALKTRLGARFLAPRSPPRKPD
jgi:SAM-dependent methyltransferase